TRPVQEADGGNLEIVDQRADVDPTVFVGVFVRPILEVLFLQPKPLRIGVHHELLAGSGEDQDLVLRVGADRLEHLAQGPMVLDTELDRSAEGVGFGEDHTVLVPVELEEVLEALAVLLEIGEGDELLQRHRAPFSTSWALTTLDTEDWSGGLAKTLEVSGSRCQISLGRWKHIASGEILQPTSGSLQSISAPFSSLRFISCEPSLAGTRSARRHEPGHGYRRKAEMRSRHIIARAEDAHYTIPAEYQQHSEGFDYWSIVDDSDPAAVHTGFGIARLEPGGSIEAHVHSFEESF